MLFVKVLSQMTEAVQSKGHFREVMQSTVGSDTQWHS